MTAGSGWGEISGFMKPDNGTYGCGAGVGANYPKGMSVVLRMPEECDTWLSAPWPEAPKLQRPLRDGTLRIVEHGAREDAAT